MNQIPSYVREFNAASMAEAIHAADQALREDGVTVAVWRNRVDYLRQEQKISRAERINNIVKNAILAGVNSKFVLYQNSLIDNTSGWRGEKITSNHVSDLGYLQNDLLMMFEVDEISIIKSAFSTAHSFIRVDISNDDGFSVHQDAMSFYPPIQENQLFLGGVIRMLENLEGSPTEFYFNKERANPYRLPVGAASFTLPKLFEEKSAWHDSTPSQGQMRAVHMVNFCVSPL